MGSTLHMGDLNLRTIPVWYVTNWNHYQALGADMATAITRFDEYARRVMRGLCLVDPSGVIWEERG